MFLQESVRTVKGSNFVRGHTNASVAPGRLCAIKEEGNVEFPNLLQVSSKCLVNLLN